MKKFLLICLCLVFAVLILPGIIQPPGESAAAKTTDVKELAHGLDEALLNYRKAHGIFPEGSAGEIVTALRTPDEKGDSYLDLAPAAVNDHGEMLDPWGTPFRITFDGVNNVPRIHSAGPNLIFEDKPGKRSDDYYSWRESEPPASPLPF